MVKKIINILFVLFIIFILLKLSYQIGYTDGIIKSIELLYEGEEVPESEEFEETKPSV